MKKLQSSSEIFLLIYGNKSDISLFTESLLTKPNLAQHLHFFIQSFMCHVLCWQFSDEQIMRQKAKLQLTQRNKEAVKPCHK